MTDTMLAPMHARSTPKNIVSTGISRMPAPRPRIAPAPPGTEVAKSAARKQWAHGPSSMRRWVPSSRSTTSGRTPR